MRNIRSIALAVTLGALTLTAQSPKPASAKAYPYTFSNFVWWSDADLRHALKQRIPSLADEIVPSSPMDKKVRLALIDLLKAKGIHADVLSYEPSPPPGQPQTSLVMGVRASKLASANVPPPSILYALAPPPQIYVGKVSVEGAPPEALVRIQQITNLLSGAPNSLNYLNTSSEIHSTLQSFGYLESTNHIDYGIPEKKSDAEYLVPLIVTIDPGQKYHVSSIAADGGPLFQGVDLSRYITAHPGDIATPYLCARLTGMLLNAYNQAGYPFADISADPILDKDHALASYKLQVDPGPLYHLRKLTLLNLDAAHQDAVQQILNMKSGDVYNSYPLMTLSYKLSSNPLFAGMRVTYKAIEDATDHVVDVTVTFSTQ